MAKCHTGVIEKCKTSFLQIIIKKLNTIVCLGGASMANNDCFVFFAGYSDYDSFKKRKLSELDGVFVNDSFRQNMGKLRFFVFRVYNHLSRKSHLFKIILAPFKNLWNKHYLSKKIRKNLPAYNSIFLFIDVAQYDLVSFDFIYYFKRKYKNAVVILVMSDKVSFYESMYNHFKIEEAKKVYDFIFTYNEFDAEKYNLEMTRPIIFDFPNKLYCTENKYDVVFIGRAKDRLNQIVNIASFLVSKNYKIFFYIVDNTESKMQISIPGFTFGGYMPYEEVLRYEGDMPP